jgi:RNA polymerase sigma-70 factor (ECF subfamily)
MSTVTVASVAKTSSEDELERIFREHYQLLYRTAYSMLGNQADAEDVPQTIFLRLLRRGIPPDLEANAARYLYRAAVNLSLDMIRARNRHKLVHGMEGLEARSEDRDSSTAEANHRRLVAALAELHPQAAQILVLRYIHDYSDAQIAKLLGVSRGTMAMRLFRARARLKKLIQISGERQ